MRHGIARLGVVLALLATSLLAPTVGETPSAPAAAADYSQFDPGNIIADAVFYNAGAMDAAGVQAFLVSKGSRCIAGAMPCLKDYATSTPSTPANARCSAYAGSARESAANVLAKVAAACGVNPQVLLVLIQKEQGLVTGSQRSVRQYERAAGYKCPDTAPCDPTYAGFFNQVYWSAWQYREYQATANTRTYRAGRENVILFHPNRACGSSTVFIANQATAGLYIYTPYQPTRAALAAGPSGVSSTSPDYDCATYGNKNFWGYFTDWFGSTQAAGGTGAGAILAKHQATGGAAGPLGAATSPAWCGLSAGGCFQLFERGSVYWAPATGAFVVTGAIRGRWGELGWENGLLGYPLTDTNCGLADSGCFQHFERGSLYDSASSPVTVVRGDVREAWAASGWENGPLGYPTTDDVGGLPEGGAFQLFQKGSVYWSPAHGAHLVRGPIRDRWAALGHERGALGYPVSDTLCGLVAGGCYHLFEGGSVYVSSATPARVVFGDVRTAWASSGAENGPLGYPVRDERAGLARGGSYQRFERGSAYWSPATGAHLVHGAIWQRWAALGYERGTLGYPVTDTLCGLVSAGCYQLFENGSLYVSSSTAATVVSGAARTAWAASGAENGPLGYPVRDERGGLLRGGSYQRFQQGSVYRSPATGAHFLYGPIWQRWAALGHERSRLGYPTADLVCGLASRGCYQPFEGGSLYTSSSTPTVVVRGAIRTAWGVTGWENGSLGYPTTDELPGLVRGGVYQVFQRGSFYWSPTTGAHPVSGPIRAHWAGLGAENGALGYPVGNPTAVAGGVQQRFQGGTLRLDTARGTVTTV